MKGISTYINEKLKFNKDFKVSNMFVPNTARDLEILLVGLLNVRGDKGDFNDIDVSAISDLSFVFSEFKEFNGDISEWDVHNAKRMSSMFRGCKDFNCDISKWDVSHVRDMSYMFCDCNSFNQDLSQWNVSDCCMISMFYGCIAMKRAGNVPKWYV